MSWELSPDQLRAIAAGRTRHHQGSPTQRIWAVDHDLMGVVTEYTFAREFQLTFTANMGRQGDGRKDNGLQVGYLSIDVKGSPTPWRLLREVDKPHADILVLAHYFRDTLTARLLGWEFDAVMLKCPIDANLPVPAHAKPARDLRPMRELHDWIDALRSKRGR